MTYHQADNFVYIDTPGFLDTSGVSDDDTVRSVLKVLKDKKQPYISTVLWFCSPSARADQTLKNQASFIARIGAEDRRRQERNNLTKRSIWQNTIILVKKGDDIDGPIQAALSNEAENPYQHKPPVVTLFIMDLHPESERIFGGMPYAQREACGRLYGREIPDFFTKLAYSREHQQNPLHIIFLEEKCKNCPASGDDKRLMPKGCHVRGAKRHPQDKVYIHRGGSLYHTGKVEKHTKLSFAKAGGTFGAGLGATEGPIGVAAIGTAGFAAGAVVDVATMLLGKGCWTCCGKKDGTSGCAYVCCNGSIVSQGCAQRYTCCNEFEPAVGCADDACKECGEELMGVRGCQANVVHDTEIL